MLAQGKGDYYGYGKVRVRVVVRAMDKVNYRYPNYHIVTIEH